MASNQEQREDLPQARAAASLRACRRGAPMPSDNMIRNSIARSLTQILVNMTNAEGQQKCRELLQVENLEHGAHIKILGHLEHIDERRDRRECAAREHKQRRVNKENHNPNN